MSRKNKIDTIKENIDELSDEQINKLYKLYEKITNDEEIEENNELTDESDESDDEDKIKEKLLLKMINKILENSNKDKIKKIKEFKNINREDIISQSKVYDKMEDKLFRIFDKKECGWYQRTKTKNYIISFLKRGVNSIGYEFISEQKEMPVKIDGVNYRKTCTLYSIK